MLSFKCALASIVIALTAALPPSLAQSSPPIVGQVTNVDLAAGRIAIKHGPIPNLGFNQSERTDEFKVREPIMLNAVQVGSRLTFTADRVDGQLTITAIVPADK